MSGWAAEAGTRTLMIAGLLCWLGPAESAPAQPADECVNATLISTVPYIEDVSVTYATSSPTDPIQSCTVSPGSNNDSVWYTYTPPVAGYVHISTCGSTYDTVLSVYTGQCGALTEVACNDDKCEFQSKLLYLRVNENEPLLIEITAYASKVATDLHFEFDFEECTAPAPPFHPEPADNAVRVDLAPTLRWNLGAGSGAAYQVIYGTDDRLDEYQITDPAWLTLGNGTVLRADRSDLIDNGDGTFTLDAFTLQQEHDVCNTEPFYDQPAIGRCSGFLVTDDMVVTAGHCMYSDLECSEAVFIFGYTMQDSATPVLTFDASDVYDCSEIIDRQQVIGAEDWALIRLDRPVTGHQPLRLRRSGKAEVGDPLTVIGHPLGLPRKYSGNAWVRDATPGNYFIANLDTYAGSSGSPVINSDTLLVEGLLSSGEIDFIPQGDCYVSNICEDNGCEGEVVTRASLFADYIPYETYDVLFGASVDFLQPVCQDVQEPFCAVGPLEPNRTYHWRVVAKNACGEFQGDIWSFRTLRLGIAGDYDDDGDVDQEDYGFLQRCYTGVGVPVTDPYCLSAGLDEDSDVDGADLAIFHACMSGPNVPADPDCDL